MINKILINIAILVCGVLTAFSQTPVLTWESGSDIGGQSTMIVSSQEARSSSISWADASGNIWLFGGESLDINGYLNDLWRYDPVMGEWTWMAGSDVINQAGTYGTLGTGSTSNIPGARSGSISWTDVSGNLWLFGGDGYDINGSNGVLTWII